MIKNEISFNIFQSEVYCPVTQQKILTGGMKIMCEYIIIIRYKIQKYIISIQVMLGN